MSLVDSSHLLAFQVGFCVRKGHWGAGEGEWMASAANLASLPEINMAPSP